MKFVITNDKNQTLWKDGDTIRWVASGGTRFSSIIAVQAIVKAHGLSNVMVATIKE